MQLNYLLIIMLITFLKTVFSEEHNEVFHMPGMLLGIFCSVILFCFWFSIRIAGPSVEEAAVWKSPWDYRGR